MRCDLWSLLVFGASQWLASAARPTNFAALTSDLVGGLEARSSRACPQEEPLRQVLLGLGLTNKELSGLPDVFGVEWEDCDVLEINLEFHPKLKGPLSPAFRELSKLETLNLGGTEVTGDLAVLDHSSELIQLDLRETKIAGDLKALEKAVGLWKLDLSKTQVSGDLEAFKNAEDLQDLDLSDTKVEGDIQALQKVTRLKKLYLENTNVSGGMASLIDSKHLDNVKISGTKITAVGTCPREEEQLRQVLLGLGLPEDKLSNLHHVDGVQWYGCDVLALDFNGRTELHGSLSPLLFEFPKLQFLNLKHTEVSGDLAMLAKCNKLTRLDLSETKVTGDVKVLQNLKWLTHIYLRDTQVTGELEAFKNALLLETLDLCRTKVTGDLQALQNAEKLRDLSLALTKVEGDIKALHKVTSLKNLYLQNTNVSGHMASLRGTQLFEVNITGTRITGGGCPQDEPLRKVLHDIGFKGSVSTAIKHHRTAIEWRGCDVVKIDLPSTWRLRPGSLSPGFRELPGLETLKLHHLEVSGDVAMLAQSSRLRELILEKTKVSGDLKFLQNASELRVLRLSDAQVSGDLQALENAQELAVLDLAKTEVDGDIRALQHVRKMKHLSLAETKVGGDLKALQSSHAMMYLNLTKTAVAGDIQALRDAKTMEKLCLSDTRVTGDLTVLQNMSQLVVLDLSERQVSGDIKALQDARMMRRLSLSETKVAGDLKVLQNMRELEILDLDRTEVGGNIEALKDASKIQVLGLSETKVTGDLKALENSAELSNLHLSKTKVGGHLQALKQATKLHNLNLVGTSIEGDIGALQDASRLKKVDLSKSKASGDIKSLNHMKYLKYLDISDTSVGGNPSALHLKWLETFKASACPLKGSIAGNLFDSLVTLDVASTLISRVDSIPSKCRSLLLADIGSMSFAPGLLRHAAENYIFVDLRNVNFTNRSDAWALLNSGAVKLSPVRTSLHNNRGFACYDLLDTSLQVSPEKFAPDRLCTCMPGWTGEGAACTKCPMNTFKKNFSDTSNECIPCPNGSTAEAGSATHRSCICKPGQLYWKDGDLTCGCPEYEALDGNACIKCEDLNLDCSTKGTEVLRAKPKAGYFRLRNQTKAVQCLEPKERCTPDSARATCQSNYSGTMCMDCAETFYASGKGCEKCVDAEIPHAVLLLLGVALAVAGGLAALFVRSRTGAEAHEIPCRRSTLMQLLKAQAPLLLQMCQLWGVLAVLATQTPTGRAQEGEDKSEPSFWEIPYVEVLQLSIANVKGALNLQCRFDGPTVRFVSALAAPVFPLVALLCCLLVEVVKPGLGITAALQALTLFYVGGASGTSTLLSCQRKDGQEEALPKAFAFRSSMPYILCEKETALKSQVDSVGYCAAVVYILLIPSCLLYLYWRQREVLRASGATTWAATPCNEGLNVQVTGLLPCTSMQKTPDEHTDRLMASSAACIAVLYRGRVQVRIVDQAAIVSPVDAAPGNTVEGDLLDLFETDEANAKALKCRAIAEMLTERAILRQALPHDRVLFGAHNLFLKYALGRTIWMEIVQKLAAVALVAIVNNIEGVMMPVAVTLVMAVTSAMVRPYSQPQVNTLHCFSFLCLTVSAVSFAWGEPWPGRIALAAPFVLSALQALRPDSAEALAIRLWQDLDRQGDALERQEVVEVTVETYRFL